MLSREQEAEIRASLEKARAALRFLDSDSLAAPRARQILDCFLEEVAESLSTRPCGDGEEEKQCRAGAEDDPARFPGAIPPPLTSEERRKIQQGTLTEAEARARRTAKYRRETAVQKTVALPFSRPRTFVVEDRDRKQRVTITLEDLLPE